MENISSSDLRVSGKLRPACSTYLVIVHNCFLSGCGAQLFNRVSPIRLLTVLSLHQTQIQRNTILLEGAGPLSQGHVPTATWPGRGGPHHRRHPCCPVRSLRKRNTSTYPCCWRKRASAPLTTPSTKVTDQILQLLAPRCWVRQKKRVTIWASSQLVSLFAFRCGSCFQTVLERDHLYLSCCWLLCKVAFVF